MTPEQRYAVRIRHENARRLVDAGIPGIIARGRSQRTYIHAQQLTVRDSRQLRVLAAGNGADVEDIGKFWFVPGYSVVGGPDIVPES